MTLTVAASPVYAGTSAATARCTSWASSRQLCPSRVTTVSATAAVPPATVGARPRPVAGAGPEPSPGRRPPARPAQVGPQRHHAGHGQRPVRRDPGHRGVGDAHAHRREAPPVARRSTRLEDPVLEHVHHLDVHPAHRHPERLLAGGDHHLPHPRGHRGQVDAVARGHGDRDPAAGGAASAPAACSIRQLRARTPAIRSTACRSTAAAAGRLSRAGPYGEARASRSCWRNSVRTAPHRPAPARRAAARSARRPSGAPRACSRPASAKAAGAVRAAALVLVGGQAGLGAVPRLRRVPSAGQRRDRRRAAPVRAHHRHGRIASASRIRARWIRPRTASSLAPVICAMSA